LRGLSHYKGQFSKSSVHEWIPLIAKRSSSAATIDTQDVRITAKDDDVLVFVNAKLRNVTNIRKYQCFS